MGRLSVIPESIAQQVLPALKAGRYSLLIGAGFSATSSNAKGERLPVGNQLATEIANHFDLPDSYPLAQIADSAPKDELQSFLISRFFGCKASRSATLVSSFVWRSIYTLNIDDVLHDCYSGQECYQNPIFLTFKDLYQRPEDPEDVIVAHLHGSVKTPQNGFVFSLPEYGDASAAGYTWFNVLADELTEQPFIIIGCSLAEPDIEAHLARRKGIPSEAQQTAPSLFITKRMDKVLEQTCKKFGLIPIEGDADSFLSYLNSEAGQRSRPLDLLGVKADVRTFLESTGVEHRSVRIFFRQWFVVDEKDLPQPIDSIPLLAGAEPTWSAISGGEDVIRECVPRLMSEVEHWKNKGGIAVSVLESPAGEGKSTVLYRTALELAKLQTNIFFFCARERLVDEDAAKVLSHLNTPAVLVVDNIADHAPQIAALLENLEQKKTPCFVLGASRRGRLAHFDTVCSRFKPREGNLKGLSEQEALALVQRLRDAGRLGSNAGISNTELAKRIRSKHLIASVAEAGDGVAQFDHLLRSELSGLSNEGQIIYRLVALAHSTGQPIKVSLLHRASKIGTSTFFSSLHGELKGIVHYVTTEYIESRHRVVSEHIVKCADEATRYELLVRLVSAIAPYVSRRTIMRGTPEARLSGRLMDFDDCIKPLVGMKADAFYEHIRPEWEWNSRFWEQRALLALSSNVDQAIVWAKHAVGIEKHPHTLTTLAKVIFRSAEKATSYREIETAVSDALSVVDDALAASSQRKRPEIHPFDVAVRGVKNAMRNYASLGRRNFPSEFVEHVERIIDAGERELGFTQTRALRSLLES
ncbi:MAG: SIR2 family protein [Aromatoleum sp.]|jgi:hypothetical protein|uniref:P-loop NTPase n=1 Tax=Aromatoleum sp. TaxID=2307007 RepID=UPI002895AD25|nr:SIR2 family protein [Aromatoleum sp.]MDT3670157.1 SIR2 family protein [Aromatoleum sp.]